ncbi:MAG: hypothetical protein WCT39_02370 [Candidatus Margulisiibacteriota bacterium]
MAPNQKTQTEGTNLKTLGLNSPQEVFDLLGLLKIDGEPIVKNEQDVLDPKLKAKAVIDYFSEKFNVKMDELPYIASLIKHDLKHGKLTWRR